MYPDALAAAIDEVAAGTDRPFAVNLPLYRKGSAEIIDLLVAKRVPVLIASQGGPKAYLERFKAVGIRCIHVVASPEHAAKAIAAGVDALVVVGGEAGGHPPASLVSTLVLLRAVARFADGAGLAAALSLGASGANFGTRFIATPEANVHDAYKQAIIAAGVSDTRTVGRDLGLIRTLRNDFTDVMDRLERDAADLETRRSTFSGSTLKDAALDGDIAKGKVEAGQSAGLVDEILPAAEIVRRIAEEYLQVRRSLPS
jgi:enoyl-[acyl-carrier protein] reductase II